MYDFAWLQSKTGSEAVSVSTDGSVLWWDIRRLGEPLESLTLQDRAPAVGAISTESPLSRGQSVLTLIVLRVRFQPNGSYWRLNFAVVVIH